MWESVDVPQKCVLVVVLKAARALFPNGAAELKRGIMLEKLREVHHVRGAKGLVVARSSRTNSSAGRPALRFFK